MSNTKGFTLAETIFAAALTALALCGLLSLFISCAFMNDASRNLTTATSHARYILEDIRNAGFTGLETRINGGGVNGWDLTSADLTAMGLVPLSSENVATVVTTPAGSNPVGVSVTVTWNDRRNRPRTLSMETAITNF